MRGPGRRNVTRLLIEGIHRKTKPSIHIISDEREAVKFTMIMHGRGFIVVCTDAIQESTVYVKQRLQRSRTPARLLHSLAGELNKYVHLFL